MNAIEVWRPQPGNVYQMDYLLLMAACRPRSIAAIISDPPYNLTNLAFEQPIDWPAFWKEARRVLVSERSPVILFSQQPFTTDLINSNRAGFRYELIWEKTAPTGFLDANRRPLRTHENILIFADGLPEYEPQMETTTLLTAVTQKSTPASHYGKHQGRGYEDTGARFPRSVWRFAQRHTAFHNTESLHPTAKPLPLMERLILTYTQPGDLILDPFAGSGSTGAAARNTGRDYVLGELDAKYVAVARERLSHGYTLPMFDTVASARAAGE